MNNILMLIGIGTIGWWIGRWTVDLMEWMRRRRNEKPDTFHDLSEHLRLCHRIVQARHNHARTQTHKDV